jgi:hypothetical protein
VINIILVSWALQHGSSYLKHLIYMLVTMAYWLVITVTTCIDDHRIHDIVYVHFIFYPKQVV